MVIAFVILTIFIIAPAIIMPLDNAPLLKGIIQMAVCSSNETLTTSYSTFEIPGESSTSIEYTCVDGQKNTRDVGDKLLWPAGSAMWCCSSLAYLHFCPLCRMRTSKPKLIRCCTQRARRPDGSRGAIGSSGRSRRKSSSLNRIRHDHSQSDHVPLAQQLQELKDALDAGLITEAEYKSKRLELLS